MGFLGLFKLNLFDPDAFDKELTSLTQAISRTRNQITALTIKRKSARNNVAYSLLIAYVAWVAYRYRVSLSNLGPLAAGKSRFSVFLSGQDTHDLIYTVIVPLVIAMAIYLVDSLFRLWISSKDKSLKSLLKRHKAKIEDLKRITNFNTTSLLLRKYSKLDRDELEDDTKKTSGIHASNQPLGTGQNSNVAEKPIPQQKKLRPTVNRPENQVKQAENKINQPEDQPKRQNIRNHQNSSAEGRRSAPLQGPIHKSIQDRLLDFIIGSDHNESVESRYALICANCYTHNGLAPPGCSDPHTVTYICRQCGYINGALETPPSSDIPGSHSDNSDGAGDSKTNWKDSLANGDSTPTPTFIVTSPSSEALTSGSSNDEHGKEKIAGKIGIGEESEADVPGAQEVKDTE